LLKRTERSLIHNKLAVVDDALITGSFNSRTRRTFSSLKAKRSPTARAAMSLALTEKYPDKGL
jgi:hypothetical protein